MSWPCLALRVKFIEAQLDHMGGSIVMGVPLVIHLNGIFPYNPSSYWGYPQLWKPPYWTWWIRQRIEATTEFIFLAKHKNTVARLVPTWWHRCSHVLRAVAIPQEIYCGLLKIYNLLGYIKIATFNGLKMRENEKTVDISGWRGEPHFPTKPYPKAGDRIGIEADIFIIIYYCGNIL